jgi:hypothetical protein
VSPLDIAAWILVVVSVALRVLCGPFAKGQKFKHEPDAEFHLPLASRWVPAKVVDIGSVISVLCLVGAALLLMCSFLA